MKSLTKVGILLSILVIPALVFLFLKGFGKNHYKLQVFYATDSVETDNGFKITSAHQIPDFNFQNQSGRMVSGKDLHNKIKVVDFFFTRCPGICPKMSAQLARVQEVYAEDTDVNILSISVDPQYDQPDTLKIYSNKYRAINEKWFFLTGSKDSIYSLARKGFFVSAMEDAEHPVDFIHSDKVILVDKNNWIRGYYNGTDKKDMDRLIDEIRVLKNIEKN